jgi:hypothetical protein
LGAHVLSLPPSNAYFDNSLVNVFFLVRAEKKILLPKNRAASTSSAAVDIRIHRRFRRVFTQSKICDNRRLDRTSSSAISDARQLLFLRFELLPDIPYDRNFAVNYIFFLLF